MKLLTIFIVSLLFSISFFSCNYTSHEEPQIIKETNLQTETIEAVDELLNNCNNNISKTIPIIVTSLVSVDNIQKSSTFGRMSAEIIASRLSQHGYNVKELKMNQKQIYVRKNQGEFILSRDIKDIAIKHNVQTVVVGTYAINKAGYQNIFVCLKIVDPISNVIGCSKCYISKSHQYNWE